MARLRFRGQPVDVDVNPARLARRVEPFRRLRERLLAEADGDEARVDAFLAARLLGAVQRFGDAYLGDTGARLDRIFTLRDRLADQVARALNGERVTPDAVTRLFDDLGSELAQLRSPTDHARHGPPPELGAPLPTARLPEPPAPRALLPTAAPALERLGGRGSLARRGLEALRRLGDDANDLRVRLERLAGSGREATAGALLRLVASLGDPPDPRALTGLRRALEQGAAEQLAAVRNSRNLTDADRVALLRRFAELDPAALQHLDLMSETGLGTAAWARLALAASPEGLARTLQAAARLRALAGDERGSGARLEALVRASLDDPQVHAWLMEIAASRRHARRLASASAAEVAALAAFAKADPAAAARLLERTAGSTRTNEAPVLSRALIAEVRAAVLAARGHLPAERLPDLARGLQRLAGLDETPSRRLPDVSGRFESEARLDPRSGELLVETSGELGVPGEVRTHRDPAAQRDVAGGTGDDAGHRIANTFGAPGDVWNLERQNWISNEFGTWRQLEIYWARRLLSGDRIEVRVRDVFRPGEARPWKRVVEWTEITPDGRRRQVEAQEFLNSSSPRQRLAERTTSRTEQVRLGDQQVTRRTTSYPLRGSGELSGVGAPAWLRDDPRYAALLERVRDELDAPVPTVERHYQGGSDGPTLTSITPRDQRPPGAAGVTLEVRDFTRPGESAPYAREVVVTVHLPDGSRRSESHLFVKPPAAP